MVPWGNWAKMKSLDVSSVVSITKVMSKYRVISRKSHERLSPAGSWCRCLMGSNAWTTQMARSAAGTMRWPHMNPRTMYRATPMQRYKAEPMSHRKVTAPAICSHPSTPSGRSSGRTTIGALLLPPLLLLLPLLPLAGREVEGGVRGGEAKSTGGAATWPAALPARPAATSAAPAAAVVLSWTPRPPVVGWVGGWVWCGEQGSRRQKEKDSPWLGVPYVPAATARMTRVLLEVSVLAAMAPRVLLLVARVAWCVLRPPPPVGSGSNRPLPAKARRCSSRPFVSGSCPRMLRWVGGWER